VRWDPEQYERYADERARPFLDLLARVGATEPRRVVDLGCGTGTGSALMSRRWPRAHVEGIDSSPDMIERASRLHTEQLTFRLSDVAQWRPGGDVDVVISNATLQWVPNPAELLRAWASDLTAGGWLAIQVPANFDAPSHALMRELAHTRRWRDRLDGVFRHHDAVRAPAEYAQLFLDAGLDADAWETTYIHRLQGEDPVVSWLRGTGLRPVLDRLSDVDGADFVRHYSALARDAYPPTAHGTLFPFRRIFAVGHR
jgi:trans-aconitate 2-methyltransferase